MLWEMFTTFFKIGAFTFGGGYAMIPIIQEEVVEKKKWIEEDEFMDAIAIAQASPGPVAVNVSVYCGHRLKGFLGALICALGTVLPSFITILLIAMFFSEFRDNQTVGKVFIGVRPAVVALILATVYKMWSKSNFEPSKVIVIIATIFLIVAFNISPIWLILAGGLGSIAIHRIKKIK